MDHKTQAAEEYRAAGICAQVGINEACCEAILSHDLPAVFTCQITDLQLNIVISGVTIHEGLYYLPDMSLALKHRTYNTHHDLWNRGGPA